MYIVFTTGPSPEGFPIDWKFDKVVKNREGEVLGFGSERDADRLMLEEHPDDAYRLSEISERQYEGTFGDPPEGMTKEEVVMQQSLGTLPPPKGTKMSIPIETGLKEYPKVTVDAHWDTFRGAPCIEIHCEQEGACAHTSRS